MTKVVNLRKEPYDTYIGRAGHNQSGYFGNPHPIGFCKICNRVHNRDDAVKEYKNYFYTRIGNDHEFKKKVLELKGQTLGCFCDKNCHGDVIAEYVDNQPSFTN